MEKTVKEKFMERAEKVLVPGGYHTEFRCTNPKCGGIASVSISCGGIRATCHACRMVTKKRV